MKSLLFFVDHETAVDLWRSTAYLYYNYTMPNWQKKQVFPFNIKETFRAIRKIASAKDSFRPQIAKSMYNCRKKDYNSLRNYRFCRDFAYKNQRWNYRIYEKENVGFRYYYIISADGSVGNIAAVNMV